MKQDSFIYKDGTTGQHIGVVGFDKIVGKAQIYDNVAEGEEPTVSDMTDLQTVVDTVYSMANNLQCPMFYGDETPAYGDINNPTVETQGFWFDTSELTQD